MKPILALALLTVSSHAATIYSGIQNFTIPADFTGIYLDIDTGTTGTSPFAGWDYSTQLFFLKFGKLDK